MFVPKCPVDNRAALVQNQWWTKSLTPYDVTIPPFVNMENENTYIQFRYEQYNDLNSVRCNI